ncbi:MAG: endonuclease/exonuclease/phosphatase, partial [Owenweeksia sp.]
MRYLLSCIVIMVLGSVSIAQNIVVVSYNIRYATDRDGENSWEKRKEAMADLLKLYKPTIIGTQEGLTRQLQYLCEELPDYSYIGVARDDGRQKGEYSAILY